MSVAKMLLLEEWDATIEPTLAEQFEQALAREDERDARARRDHQTLRIVVDNDRL